MAETPPAELIFTRSFLIALFLSLLAWFPVQAEEDDWGDDWTEEPTGLVWNGFVEAAYGLRVSEPTEPALSTLSELRARTETHWSRDTLEVNFKADFSHDRMAHNNEFQIRDLNLAFSLGEHIDIKAGRQVLTWGTGDLIFLNDLFPKDFVSFFAGREDEYLKAPSTAVRVTLYNKLFNTDLVWTPVFEGDEFLDGERFSFYLPGLNEIGAPQPKLNANLPQTGWGNGEWALRLFKRLGAGEYALYGYRGYFKQPTARDSSGQPGYAPMNAWGFSLRHPAGTGLVSAEAVWNESRDDNDGRNPAIPNSKAKWFIGYERELVKNLTAAVQLYGEWVQHHKRAIRSSPFPAAEPEEKLTWWTLRLSYRARRDTLIWSLFSFVSPTARDYHLRPNLTWRINDAWSVSGGANLFGGSDETTLFGQLQNNSNVYLRLRRYY